MCTAEAWISSSETPNALLHVKAVSELETESRSFKTFLVAQPQSYLCYCSIIS